MEIAHAVSVRRRFDLGVAWRWACRRGGARPALPGGRRRARPNRRCPFRSSSAFGVGLLGTLALALSRYDAAVALGVLLLAVVRIEPAPSDLVFAVVIAVALVTGPLLPRAGAPERDACSSAGSSR